MLIFWAKNSVGAIFSAFCNCDDDDDGHDALVVLTSCNLLHAQMRPLSNMQIVTITQSWEYDNVYDDDNPVNVDGAGCDDGGNDVLKGILWRKSDDG